MYMGIGVHMSRASKQRAWSFSFLPGLAFSFSFFVSLLDFAYRLFFKADTRRKSRDHAGQTQYLEGEAMGIASTLLSKRCVIVSKGHRPTNSPGSSRVVGTPAAQISLNSAHGLVTFGNY